MKNFKVTKRASSILTSFSTAGTGGFAILNSSIASYSLFNKYVVAIFMFLFGVNFNIYFLILLLSFCFLPYCLFGFCQSHKL